MNNNKRLSNIDFPFAIYMKILVTIVFIIAAIAVVGQPSIKDMLPKPPNIASLGKYGEVPVALNRGQIEFSVPLYNIKSGDLEIPVTLAYNNRGLKVSEIPSWVGHGWDVMAGGAIIRQVNGLTDDSGDGFFAQHIRDRLDQYFSGQMTLQARSHLFFDLATSKIDGQPDIFSFIVNGKSGKFYFDKNLAIHQMPASGFKIFVEYFVPPSPTSVPQPKSFKIIDNDGITYDFGLAVVSQISYSPNFPAVDDNTFQANASTWLLTKITTPSGRIADFTYEQNGQISKTEEYKTVILKQFDPFDQDGNPSCQLSNWANSNIQTEVSEFSLKRIDFDLGYVVFEKGELREDIQNAFSQQTLNMHALSGLKVYDITNNLIKSVQFDYEYFGDNSRLKLKRIVFGDSSNAPVGNYEFTYIGEFDPFPGFHRTQWRNYSQDYWGFYNGRDNTSLNPDKVIDPIYFSGPPANGDAYTRPPQSWLGDRRPDSEYAKFGMLQRVKYPTGGTTTFSYSPNLIDYGPSSESDLPVLFTDLVLDRQQLLDESVPTNDTRALNFNLAQITDLWVTSVISTDDLAGLLSPSITFSGPSDLQQAYFASGRVLSPGVTEYKFYFKKANPGQYTINISTQTLGQQYNSTVSISILKAPERRLISADGMRVSKVVSCGDEEDCNTKIYIYKDPTSIDIPQFISFLSKAVTPSYHCNFLNLYESALNSAWGIEYEKVTELSGENGENGKTEYTYQLVADVNTQSEPFPSQVFRSWASNMKKEQQYVKNIDGSYTLAAETESSFATDWIHGNQIVYQILNNGIKASLSYLGLDLIQGSDSEFHVGLMPLYSEFHRVSSVSSRTFARSGPSYMELAKSSTYTYSNLVHLLPTKVTTQTGDNKIFEERYYYPLDNSGNLSLTAQMVKDEMIQRNMNSKLLMKARYLDGALLDQSISNYSIRNNLVTLDSFQDFDKSTSSFYSRIQVVKTDLRGNPLELVESDGQRIVLLYGYNASLVIGSVRAATFSDVIAAMALTETEYYILSNECSPSATYTDKVASIRTALPETMVNTYVHRPLVGTIESKDQNNLSTYFEYDSFGRLYEVKDHNGNILKSYKYHYGSN